MILVVDNGVVAGAMVGDGGSIGGSGNGRLTCGMLSLDSVNWSRRVEN